MKFYVTFPQKNEVLKDKFSIIYAEDAEEARAIAFQEYDNNWAFLYKESQYQECIGIYKLGLHQTLGDLSCK